jgi:hypothetical protein
MISDDDAVARLAEVADTLLSVMQGERPAVDAATDALGPLGIDPFTRPA